MTLDRFVPRSLTHSSKGICDECSSTQTGQVAQARQGVEGDQACSTQGARQSSEAPGRRQAEGSHETCPAAKSDETDET